jgi:hypothetical protein
MYREQELLDVFTFLRKIFCRTIVGNGPDETGNNFFAVWVEICLAFKPQSSDKGEQNCRLQDQQKLLIFSVKKKEKNIRYSLVRCFKLKT